MCTFVVAQKKFNLTEIVLKDEEGVLIEEDSFHFFDQQIIFVEPKQQISQLREWQG